jgi:hypothetical protein
VQKNELIKHTGAIHITNTLTLVQRKTSNVLLKNAFPSLLEHETHSMAIADVAAAIGLESNNHDAIKDALRVLAKTQLEWNILGTDRKNEWGVSTALASVRIKDGICEYAYSPHLRELLRNPNIYARLNLVVQNGFRSKHALALWELLSGALSAGKAEKVSTEWMSLDSYRQLLGFSTSDYPEFKYLNRDLIKFPLSEINRVSDIQADVEYQRKNRVVTGLRFHVERKGTFQLALDMKPVQRGEDDESEDAALAEIDALVTRGVTESVARRLVQSHGKDAVRRQIEHFDHLAEQGRRPESGGWFVKALTENFALPAGLVPAAERELRKKQSALLEGAQRLFDTGDFAGALGKAEACLLLGPSAAAESLAENAQNRLADLTSQARISTAESTLAPAELEALQQRAIERLEAEGDAFLQEDYRKRGRDSLAFKIYMEKVLSERLNA